MATLLDLALVTKQGRSPSNQAQKTAHPMALRLVLKRAHLPNTNLPFASAHQTRIIGHLLPMSSGPSRFACSSG